MIKEHAEILEILKSKISKLSYLYINIKKEKQILIEDKFTLIEQIEILKNKNKTLEKNYETLKLAKTFAANSQDNNIAKAKIKKIVKEIDKCISLLNK